jgi:hypothetical protein
MGNGMQTYTAQVGPDNASKLSVATATAEVSPIEDIGGGSIQVNNLDVLRLRGPGEDGRITDDPDEGLQIWVGDEGYPLFDPLGEAVADALGAQTLYGEAKREADRAGRKYALAVANLVTMAGSTTAAAEQLGVAEDEIERLVAETDD